MPSVLAAGTAPAGNVITAAVCRDALQGNEPISFISILTRSECASGEALPDQEEKKTETGNEDRDGGIGIGCEQMLSGLVAQLFAAASGQAEGAAQAGQSEISLSEPDASVIPSFSGAVQNGDASVIPVFPGAVQSGNAAASAVSLPGYEENFAAALSLGADQEDADTGVMPKECGGTSVVSVLKAEIADKIADTIRSMGESETADNSAGDMPGRGKDTELTAALEGITQTEDRIYTDAAEKINEAGLLSSAVEKALDSFLNDLSAAEGDKSEIRIVLEPESLGKLSILVSHGESGISAKIRSDNRETCAMITDQIQKLIQSMESKGIRVDDVDVVFGQMDNSSGFTQLGHNGSGGNTPQHYYSSQPQEKPEASDDGILDILRRDLAVGDGVNGAVEYRI